MGGGDVEKSDSATVDNIASRLQNSIGAYITENKIDTKDYVEPLESQPASSNQDIDDDDLPF